MANAGYDFIWTEMQHDQRDGRRRDHVAPVHAKAVLGVRVATPMSARLARDGRRRARAGRADRRPVEEAITAQLAYFPPRLPKPGRRHGVQRRHVGRVPGGYRNTINDNLVLILMIETLEGLKNADAIAKVPGVTAVFAASGPRHLGLSARQPGLRAGDQHRLDAAIKAGVRLCAARLARPADYVPRPAARPRSHAAWRAVRWAIRKENRKWVRSRRRRPGRGRSQE
jgi:2-keto-3-deoxy-L-rhamnonate aldolase RhmA